MQNWALSSWMFLKRTPTLVFAMAVLGIGLTTASGVMVRGIRNANDTITVTGASTERITSDYVDWSVKVSQSGASQQASYQGLQPAVEQTVAFLKAQGIEADEMELDSVKSEKQEVRDPRTGELRSTTWTSTQAVLIGSWNVAKIYTISGQIGQLIGKGVPLEWVDMLARATKDARAEAGADTGSYDTRTIKKDITAVMAVTFRVE